MYVSVIRSHWFTSYQNFILLFAYINISICTKLHIFTQFEHLNKTEVFSSSLSFIFSLYHTIWAKKIHMYKIWYKQKHTWFFFHMSGFTGSKHPFEDNSSQNKPEHRLQLIADACLHARLFWSHFKRDVLSWLNMHPCRDLSDCEVWDACVTHSRSSLGRWEKDSGSNDSMLLKCRYLCERESHCFTCHKHSI